MLIPKSLKIGPHRYKVVLRQEIPGVEEGKYFYGLTSYCPQIIELAYSCGEEILTPGKIAETFMHEIIEAIDGDNHLELDHRVLSTLATQLYQVMRDNKLDFSK